MKIPESWVITEAFAIRHKKTGFFIPQINPGHRRGGSLVEPEDPRKKQPRIFQNLPSAKSYLVQWCRGKHICHRSGEYDSYDEEIEIIPQPNRNKDDMEIIPVVLIPKEF